MVAYEKQIASRIRVPAHNAFKMLEESGEANAEWLRFFQLISGPPKPIQALHPPAGGGTYAFTANTPGTFWIPSPTGVGSITLIRGKPPQGGTPYNPVVIAPSGTPVPAGGAGGPGVPYNTANNFIDYTADQGVSPNVLTISTLYYQGDSARETNPSNANIQQWQVFVSTQNAMKATGSTGKYFWRWKNSLDTSNGRLGLAPAPFPYDGSELGGAGSSKNIGFVTQSGIIGCNGSLGYTTHPAAVSQNDIIEFAYDTVNHKLWIRNFTQSANWYGANAIGDPALNINGIDLPTIMGVFWPQDLYASGNFSGTFGEIYTTWTALVNDTTNMPAGYTLAPGWSTGATTYNYTYSQVPASSGAAQGKGTVIQLPQTSGPVPLSVGDTVYITYTTPPGIYWVPATGA
jgi:hypothetical protein